MSPRLFNVFMDVLAERMGPYRINIEKSVIILLPDDVQLTAKSRLELKENLEIAFAWAIESEMT